MNFIKLKSFFLSVFGVCATTSLILVFFLSPAQAASLSKNIFPQTLEGFPLYQIEDLGLGKWGQEQGWTTSYKAYYTDQETAEISVAVIYGESEAGISNNWEPFFNEYRNAFREGFGAELSSVDSTSVKGYPAKYFRATLGEGYTAYFFKYDVHLFLPVANYLIFVTISQEQEPSLSQAERVAGEFINRVKSQRDDGESCVSAFECQSNYCVHGICRSLPTFCGDDKCDSGETCDCSDCVNLPQCQKEEPSQVSTQTQSAEKSELGEIKTEVIKKPYFISWIWFIIILIIILAVISGFIIYRKRRKILPKELKTKVQELSSWIKRNKKKIITIFLVILEVIILGLVLIFTMVMLQ